MEKFLDHKTHGTPAFATATAGWHENGAGRLAKALECGGKRYSARHRFWGLDLAGQRSGSLGQEAGGIGGLLAFTVTSNNVEKVYLPIADAMGNIHKVVDTTTGVVAVEYDYDPFGKPISEAFPNSRIPEFAHFSCPFRFQSKYYDAETGLYYFGYRYYDPASCKWLCRDPLQEQGGINLTAYCSNDPVNKVDPLGLWDFDMHYYAVYMALLSAGVEKAEDKDKAWLIAYWSATPDIDPRHDAVGPLYITPRIAYIQGSQSRAGTAQRVLHQLNGLKGQDIEKMREALRKLYKESTDPVVKGYVLHSLGDTYGHMVAKKRGGIPGLINKFFLTGVTKEETYLGPLGHARDYQYTDWVSLRPDLAESYLRDLYSLVGGKDKDVNNLIREMRTKLNPEKTSAERACENWKRYVSSNRKSRFPIYARDWDPVKKKPLNDVRTVANMTGGKFDENFVLPILNDLADSGVALP